MEKLLKELSNLGASIVDIAKTLKDGNTDWAIEKLEKTAGDVLSTIELAKTTDEDEAVVTDSDKDVGEDKGEGDDAITDTDSEEEGADKVVATDEEPKEEPLTKAQEESLKKYVDMYISSDNIAKILQALSNANVDFEELFKTVKSNKETLEKITKWLSKQTIQKTAGESDSKDPFATLDLFN